MSGGGAVTLEGVNARVVALENGQSEIIAGLKEIRTDLKGSSKTQWPVVFAGLGFMLGVLGFVGTAWKAPIEATMGRMDTDIRQLQANVVPRAEHADKQRQTEDMMAAMRERTTRDVNAIKESMASTDKGILDRIDRLENRVFAITPGKRAEIQLR